MTIAHAGPSILAAFLASLVEFLEALTVILAVGTVRGWRSALGGTAAALALLMLAVLVLGPALTRVPVGVLQLVVGTLMTLFGMRWLRKAILRASGVIPLHDEQATFASQAASMRRARSAGGAWDAIAFGTAFQITVLEGMEVVFIVVAIAVGGMGLLLPAGLGALAALLVVVVLGIALHRPLAGVPENTLKFAVGVMLSALGTFWLGEGAGLGWPGADWSVLGLIAGFLVVALGATEICRARVAAPGAIAGR